MKVTACTENQLLGQDLELCIVQPAGTEQNPEQRYRCPIRSCSYIGARVNHAGECLRHILEPRQGVAEHHRFLSNKLVCFYNAEGRPALCSRTATQSAFSFLPDKQPHLKALAYMKVSHSSRHQTVYCCCVTRGALLL